MKIWRICPKCLLAAEYHKKDVCANCGGPIIDCPLEDTAASRVRPHKGA